MAPGDIQLQDRQPTEHELATHSQSTIRLETDTWDSASQSSETETEFGGNANNHIFTVQADIHSSNTGTAICNLKLVPTDIESTDSISGEENLQSEDLVIQALSSHQYPISETDALNVHAASNMTQSDISPLTLTSTSLFSSQRESPNQNMDSSDNIHFQSDSNSLSENSLMMNSESHPVYPEQESPRSDLTIVGVQPVNMDYGHPVINDISDMTVYAINVGNSHLQNVRDQMHQGSRLNPADPLDVAQLYGIEPRNDNTRTERTQAEVLQRWSRDNQPQNIF